MAVFCIFAQLTFHLSLFIFHLASILVTISLPLRTSQVGPFPDLYLFFIWYIPVAVPVVVNEPDFQFYLQNYTKN